jgi:hypothetical protein
MPSVLCGAFRFIVTVDSTSSWLQKSKLKDKGTCGTSNQWSKTKVSPLTLGLFSSPYTAIHIYFIQMMYIKLLDGLET